VFGPYPPPFTSVGGIDGNHRERQDGKTGVGLIRYLGDGIVGDPDPQDGRKDFRNAPDIDPGVGDIIRDLVYIQHEVVAGILDLKAVADRPFRGPGDVLVIGNHEDFPAVGPRNRNDGISYGKDGIGGILDIRRFIILNLDLAGRRDILRDGPGIRMVVGRPAINRQPGCSAVDAVGDGHVVGNLPDDIPEYLVARPVRPNLAAVGRGDGDTGSGYLEYRFGCILRRGAGIIVYAHFTVIRDIVRYMPDIGALVGNTAGNAFPGAAVVHRILQNEVVAD